LDLTEKIGDMFKVLDLFVKADTGKWALLRANHYQSLKLKQFIKKAIDKKLPDPSTK